MNEGANLRVITDVSDMQRMTASIKQKMLDKYATKNTHAGSMHQTQATIGCKESFHAARNADRRSQQSPIDCEPWSSHATNQYPSFGTFDLTQQTFDAMPRTFDAAQRDTRYFNKPEDLRSKSNSNIGCGLYRSKNSAQNRSSASLNAPNQLHCHELGRKTMNATQSINQIKNQQSCNSYFLKSSASVSQLSQTRAVGGLTQNT